MSRETVALAMAAVYDRGETPSPATQPPRTHLPLDARLDAQMRREYRDAFDAAASRLSLEPGSEFPGLEFVGVSTQINTDGHPWLKLLATDGTTWYVGWQGEAEDANSLASEFGVMMAESFD